MSQNYPPAKKPTERVAIFSAAFFFFALAGLFTLHIVWPWVLLFIFLMAVPIIIAEEGWKMGLWIITQTGLWTGGVAFLIWSHFLWPGVLVLIGMSTLLAAIAPPDKIQEASRRPRDRKAKYEKPKRGLPLPLERLEEDSIIEEDNESYPLEAEERRKAR